VRVRGPIKESENWTKVWLWCSASIGSCLLTTWWDNKFNTELWLIFRRMRKCVCVCAPTFTCRILALRNIALQIRTQHNNSEFHCALFKTIFIPNVTYIIMSVSAHMRSGLEIGAGCNCLPRTRQSARARRVFGLGDCRLVWRRVLVGQKWCRTQNFFFQDFKEKCQWAFGLQLLAPHTSKCSCATSLSIGWLPLGVKAGPSRPKVVPHSKLFFSRF